MWQGTEGPRRASNLGLQSYKAHALTILPKGYPLAKWPGNMINWSAGPSGAEKTPRNTERND